ncbi:hypothetical protein [Streptomyces sp. NPDC056013]|uniref:hypothetical protein n=1 Tax=Streptomyces sp. NPDC056013 TaxID=3345680 RepID=UPI0035DBFE6C
MGFSGHPVFARTERPLLEAPLFGRRDPVLRDDIQEWRTRPGGWQTLQVSQGIWEDKYLFALVQWTGAPACVADVSDRSIALVTGLDTSGRRWQAWLNLDNAAALLVEEPKDVDDVSLWLATPEFEAVIGAKRAVLDAEVPTDAAGALAWASVAGVQKAAQQSRIEELLRARETFVEELFDALLDETGLPRSRPVLTCAIRDDVGAAGSSAGVESPCVASKAGPKAPECRTAGLSVAQDTVRRDGPDGDRQGLAAMGGGSDRPRQPARDWRYLATSPPPTSQLPFLRAEVDRMAAKRPRRPPGTPVPPGRRRRQRPTVVPDV